MPNVDPEDEIYRGQATINYKPSIWGWFIPPIKIVILGMVYPLKELRAIAEMDTQ
jgi:hypothetical protein